ncbi:hypothetical protein CYMTET_50815 [Cymbomonas tetramitiformis]|uniref:Uncharacterized protein n=1 Tax=Cymbomonas tetramitiformis TaxID=36881 RepID=A0AAE0EUD6_9CHLO|nr:hypothetical protein CYMTET_50815 [Cymbomonas tetramitiformis]
MKPVSLNLAIHVCTRALVFLAAIGRLVSSRQSCNLCDPYLRRVNCTQEGRQFKLCPLEGRYAMLDEQEWRCLEDPKKARGWEFFRELDLRADWQAGMKASTLAAPSTYMTLGMFLKPDRKAKLSDSCFQNGGEGKGCSIFNTIGTPCHLDDPSENAHLSGSTSLCLRFKGLGEGDVILRFMWKEPTPETSCHFGAERSQGWLKQLPSPWADSPDATITVVSPFELNQTASKLREKCPRLLKKLGRALQGSFPIEKDDASMRAMILRNPLLSKPAMLVRLELFNYGWNDKDKAALFAKFLPDATDFTANIFRQEHGDKIVTLAHACYTQTSVKLVGLSAGNNAVNFLTSDGNKEMAEAIAHSPKHMKQVAGGAQLWPHVQVPSPGVASAPPCCISSPLACRPGKRLPPKPHMYRPRGEWLVGRS